jgi:hypothetical protein
LFAYRLLKFKCDPKICTNRFDADLNGKNKLPETGMGGGYWRKKIPATVWQGFFFVAGCIVGVRLALC